MTDAGAAMEAIGARALGETPPNPTPLDAARGHAGLGLPLPRTRFMLWKRVVVRAARVFLHRQIAFNEAVVDAVDALQVREQGHARDIDLLRDQASQAFASAFETSDLVPRQLALVDAKLSASAAATASIDAALHEQVGHVREIDTRLTGVEQQRGDGAGSDHRLAERLAALEAKVADQQARLELRARQEAADDVAGGIGGRARPADLDAFYAAFELAFRGSESVVRERQTEFLDDLKANAAVQAAGVLDVGCGRGELLGLLRDNGLRGVGVDTSEEFVQHNREAGHDVVLADALDYLRKIPEGSFGAITAFHIIEHMAHDEALLLLDAALTALRPGGVLIVETPNPSNLLVGAGFFYLDPTHLRPVHPDYLKFAAIERGFVDAEIRWLHPMTGLQLSLPDGEDVAAATRDVVESLNRWLFGAQDYALLAHKPA